MYTMHLQTQEKFTFSFWLIFEKDERVFEQDSYEHPVDFLFNQNLPGWRT